MSMYPGATPDRGQHRARVPEEERLELTDPESATGDELVEDGRNPTQRELDSESAAERKRPVVAPDSRPVGSRTREPTEGDAMDRNRIQGKRKEVEGKLQQGLGKAKDKLRSLPDEARARLEREKGKR